MNKSGRCGEKTLILPCVGRSAVSHHDGIDAEGREPTVGALGGAGAFAEQTAFGEVAKKGKDGKHSFVLICEKFGFIGFDDGRLLARSRPTIDGFRCCSTHTTATALFILSVLANIMGFLGFRTVGRIRRRQSAISKHVPVLGGLLTRIRPTVLLLPKAGKVFNFQQLINVTIDNIFTTCRFLRHV